MLLQQYLCLLCIALHLLTSDYQISLDSVWWYKHEYCKNNRINIIWLLAVLVFPPINCSSCATGCQAIAEHTAAGKMIGIDRGSVVTPISPVSMFWLGCCYHLICDTRSSSPHICASLALKYNWLKIWMDSFTSPISTYILLYNQSTELFIWWSWWSYTHADLIVHCWCFPCICSPN